MTESRVYAYGASDPTDGWPATAAEMQAQRRLWNALVDIDRAHDQRVQEAAEAALPELAETRAELRNLDERIRATVQARREAHQQARQRVATPELDGRLADLRKQEQAARKEYWRLMRRWRRDYGDAAKRLEAQRKAEIAQARKASGLYWGNYNRVVADYETARKTARQKGRKLRKQDEADVTGGVLTVQIQRTASGLGAAPDEIFGGTVKSVRIAPISDHAAKTRLPTRQRTRATTTTATLRVDAAGHTITLPVYLHRALPTDCRVKQVQLTWRREGRRTRWQLCLTITRPSADVWNPSQTVAGIDLGWRKQSDGSLRVATVADNAGDHDVYALPADWWRKMARYESNLAEADQITMDLARQLWPRLTEVPQRVQDALANWTPRRGVKWIDVGMLRQAARAGDGPDELTAWNERYKWLVDKSLPSRPRLLRRRRELYRNWARQLAAQYSVIALEDMDLSQIARVRNAQDDAQMFAAARHQRQLACVHELRDEIVDQAAKHGTVIVWARGKTTMACGSCGKATGQQDRSKLDWTCEHCGSSWDQDHNAARNLAFVAASQAARAAE